MTYIYIFEDGEVGLSKDAPGPDDLACIGDGTLEVLKFEDGVIRGIRENGIDEYGLPDADWYDDTTKQFHIIHD